MFCVLYFSIEKNEEDFTYEVVENVMTYVNYITILFVFPISTIFFSYLSYSELEIKHIKQLYKPNSINDYLLCFVLLYNLSIIFWVIQNYIIKDSTFTLLLRSFNYIYFISSYYCLHRINIQIQIFDYVL